MRGGERWPGMTFCWRCGETARRSKPRTIRPPGRRSPAVGSEHLSARRGRRGANLTNTARGTPRDRRTCGYSDFDRPRCREASRSAGPLDPTASRAPSFFESRGFSRRSASSATAENAAHPGPDKEQGRCRAPSLSLMQSIAKRCVSKDEAGHRFSWFETHSFGALLTMRGHRLLAGLFFFQLQRCHLAADREIRIGKLQRA